MQRKGQVEIIIILAVIIVGVVIVILNLGPSTTIPDNGIDTNVEFGPIRDYVINIMRQEVDDIILTLESHGGYIDVPGDNNPIFLFQEVPIYQACESTFVPTLNDIEARFERELYNYIRSSGGIESGEIASKNVVFNKMDFTESDVSVEIFDNEIEFDIYLPTSIEGQPVSAPYNFRIPSSFGRIYNFAYDFSHQAAKDVEDGGRFFEVFFINEARVGGTIPTAAWLTDCEVYTYSGESISEGLLLTAWATTRVDLWKPYGRAGPSDPVPFPLPYVSSNSESHVYDDLDITFHLEDDFSVAAQDDFVIDNTAPVLCTSIAGLCTTTCMKYYSVAYGLEYPVIMRVRDPYSGYYNFATIVSIQEGFAEGYIDAAEVAEIIRSGIHESLEDIDIQSHSLFLIDQDGLDIPESFGDPVTDTDLNLAHFDPVDSVCWYDSDGSESINPGDLLFQGAGGCTIEVNGETVQGNFVTEAISVSHGLLYDDVNEDDRYQYGGESVYIDMGNSFQQNYEVFSDQIADYTRSVEFLGAITQGAESVVTMKPGMGCGLNG